MPPISLISSFAVVAFALIVVPGPSVMFVVSRAVGLGRRAALMTVLGNATGIYAQVVLVALGLGAVVEQSVTVFTATKLLGACYLSWLGIQAIRHRREMATTLDHDSVMVPRRSVFVDGFIVGIANPKAIVFLPPSCRNSSNLAVLQRVCRWPFLDLFLWR